MGYYKVLSAPIAAMAPSNYKGLYRSEPFPQTNEDKIIPLWERYVQYLEPLTNMGITTELTINELKELAVLGAQSTGDNYEVIFFDEVANRPHEAQYYGIDVVGKGGYSAICEALFQDKDTCDIAEEPTLSLKANYCDRLNVNGLFEDESVASGFLSSLNQVKSQFESEDWRLVFIYCVYSATH
jgi:hypothetical protein